MDGLSLDVKREKIESLRNLFPEIVSEEKIDWERLRATLGEDVSISNERYVLNWAGKTDAFRTLQTGTTATLAPAKEESINFDTTDNVFIEGENLEVLKVLQKAYFGKIKCIIIDPPYNTGNDSFIYPDRFSETKEEYMKRVGDKDEEGFLMKEGLFRKNSKENGQYHSNWLSMMYPRLFLARNLLRDDGVIFIHIDDNEVHNLRLLMNEIFGEENFEGQIHWRRRHNQPNDRTKMIGIVAEHIVSYSKNQEIFKMKGVGKIDLTGKFTNPDNDIRGDWASKPWKVGSDQSGSRYEITSPSGKVFDEEWMGDKNTYKELYNDNRIIFPKNGDGLPRKKYFKFEREEEGQCATNWWHHSEFGHNQGANEEMTSLFGVKNLFDNPKPKEVTRGLIQISNAKHGDIILDFFAGSGTTAQAVIELNIEDKISRNYLLVQLPEIIEKTEESYKLGYRYISEICKDRIKKVINRIIDKNTSLFSDMNFDLGFKVFKLKPSNFKQWRTDIQNVEELEQQLDAFTDPVKPEADEENMLYELLLKLGKDFQTKIERKIVDNSAFYQINHDEIVIQLSGSPSQTLNDILMINQSRVERKEESKEKMKVIMLDRLFENNDQLKTNTYLQFKDAGVDFRTV